MTAKEYLMQYRESIEDTKAAIDRIRQLREICENLRDETGQSVALEKALADLIDAKNEAAAELDRYCKIRADIQRTIALVRDVRYRSLLHARYILGLTWKQTAVHIGYEVRQTTRLHGQALIVVDCILSQDARACDFPHV